ncbi:MAG: 16S rRNA (cytosine(1402)-N(4))-methyltransferase, partial [Acidobacteria bacterium]|nr:16S rRNA (cytosine(1402)-N(4))-methyltransferase [Acidobacteriota bacterium]
MTRSSMPTHEPVMTAEMVAVLDPSRGGLFVDCTVGGGGHARALLEAGAERLLGLDRDGEALPAAADKLRPWADRVDLAHADFRNLEAVLAERSIADIDGGALADLGLSSLQLDSGGRGFSYRHDGPLDMRMDRSTGPTAADLLHAAPESELA